jgi:hypothetical protein
MKTTNRSIMRALAIPGLMTLLVATGCDLGKVLQVQPANLIPADTLEQPVNAALLVAGAASDFDCAYNSFVVVGALIGEEFEDALQTAARWPYDQRSVSASQSFYSQNSCTGGGVYTPLQSARVAASNIRTLLEGWTDAEVAPQNRQLLIARAAAYEAWSQLLLSEAFCNTVFSSISGEEITWGTQITAAQARDSAIARFTQAITTAQAVGGTVADSIRFFSLVGRARAYHDAGNMTAARADAALVPAAFVWNITASGTTARRNNRVFQESNSVVNQQSSSVGLRYRTLNDPRVPVLNRNRVSAGTGVAQWSQMKYTAVTSSLPAATGTEMQLLIAEADIATNRANTLAIIAASRTAGGQGAYTGTTPAQDLAEIIDQRRRALFLTGTHWGDIIRYNLTLSPAAGLATPWGQTFGPSAGSAQCLPLPEVEILNNPNLS